MHVSLSLYLASGNRFDRLKRALLRLINSSYNKLLNMNLFPPRTFREDMPHKTGERVDRWSTHLYIVLVNVLVFLSDRHCIDTSTLNLPYYRQEKN